MATVLDMTAKKKTGKGKVKNKRLSKTVDGSKTKKKATKKKTRRINPTKPKSKVIIPNKKSQPVRKTKKTASGNRSTSGNQILKVTKQPSGMGSSKKKTNATYQRRKIKHIWPAIGTIIIGRLRKQTFRAEIVDDPDLHKDHERAIKSLDDPKLPLTYSFNTAAQQFTKALRDKYGMKPIANGWKWWRRENDNKRLFDIPEYSKVIED